MPAAAHTEKDGSYTNTQRLFQWSLGEKLRSIASVAALQFTPADLDQIRAHDDWKKPIYRKVVLALQQIRRHTNRVKYIYILRKTADAGQRQLRLVPAHQRKHLRQVFSG